MDNLTQEWFLDVVGEIYQSVFDLTQLANVIERIMRDIQGDSFILRLQDNVDNSVGFSIYSGYEPQWTKAYQDYFYKVDPYPEAIKNNPISIESGEPFLTDLFLKSEYYNDFLKPQNKYHCMGGHILRNDRYFVMFALQRHKKAQAFQEKEIQALNILMPHFQRVLKLNKQFSAINTQKQIAELALGCIPYGIIVFEENLKPSYINHAAEEVLAGDFGLKLMSQGIVTSISAESQQLQHMIRQGLGVAVGHGEIEKNGMQITPTREDRRPINAVVIPLRPESRKMGILSPGPRVLLFLSTLDQSATCKSGGSLLKNLFGLTTAEAYLVRNLASGQDLDEIATTKGCTRNTVRNQLKSVFAKTGTCRQAELVRLLMMLPNEA